jgi:hypothetical protein
MFSGAENAVFWPGKRRFPAGEPILEINLLTS